MKIQGIDFSSPFTEKEWQNLRKEKESEVNRTNNYFKCTKCGGKLIEEGMSGIYFCENCKALYFKNEKGEYEIREGVRIE